jgi:DNA-binding IclR family transcriptional regulator
VTVTTTDQGRWETRLTRIATCDGELVAGETTVAAPVVGPGGRVVAALETVVPDLGGMDVVRQLLTVSARGMSRELMGSGLPSAAAAS